MSHLPTATCVFFQFLASRGVKYLAEELAPDRVFMLLFPFLPSPVFPSLWILFFKSYFLVLPFRDSDIIGKETLCSLCSLYFLSKEQVGLLLLPLILENALVTFFWSISDNQVKDRWLSLYIEWFISYSGYVKNKLPWDGKNSLFVFLSPSTIIDA